MKKLTIRSIIRLPDRIKTHSFYTPCTLCLYALFLSLILSHTAALADDFVLVNSKAAQAFISKDYQLALDEFDQLGNKYPDNLDIKRYQAICRERLGQHQQAIEILQELILISPNSVSSHYHLGTIYYTQQQSDLATQHFEQVILLAKDSKYAELAETYLNVIAKQRFSNLIPGAPKKWSTYVFAGFTEDIDSPDSFAANETADTRYNVYLYSSYYFLRNHRWTGLVGASVYQSNQSGSPSAQDDLMRWSINSNFQLQSIIAGKPVTYSIGLRYQETEFDHRPYSDGLAGHFGSRIGFVENTSTYFYLTVGQDSFRDFLGFNPNFNLSRQKRNTIGVDHSYFFNQRNIELGAGIVISDIDSDSVNLSRESNGIRLFGYFFLPRDFRLRILTLWQDDDYHEFAGPGNRDAKSVGYSASLSRQFTKHISATIAYRLDQTDFSDIDPDSRRSTWGMNIAYVF